MGKWSCVNVSGLVVELHVAPGHDGYSSLGAASAAPWTRSTRAALARPSNTIVAGAFLWGLDPDRDPQEVPSALMDDPVPDFSLPPLEGTGVLGFSSADLRADKVILVNVFASWCLPCRIEHPFLMRIAEDGTAPIYGIDYKDKQSDAVNWLAERGNPYVAIGADENGRVTIDWGISGVPETIVIDKAGVIRYRHVGPLFPEILEETILPLIRSLREK